MHPRLTELLAYIDTELAKLRTAYEAVPADRRGTRAVPDRWSPAEVVHHVMIVERMLTQRLAGLINEARGLAPETDEGSALARIDTQRVAERTKRFVTGERSEPRETDPARLWSDFEQTRRELKQVVATADGVAIGAVSAPHPALGALDGYEWIAFAGSHAARHADQIREDYLASRPTAH